MSKMIEIGERERERERNRKGKWGKWFLFYQAYKNTLASTLFIV